MPAPAQLAFAMGLARHSRLSTFTLQLDKGVAWVACATFALSADWWWTVANQAG